MASTFSPLLRIELIGAGEQSGAWNNTTNTNLGTLLEQAIAGSTSVSLAGTATYDLGGSAAIANGASDIQRNIAISFTGNPGADAVITVPSTSKIYFIRNATDGGWALKLKTSSQTLPNAITVPNGRTMIVGCDGTNAVPGINSLPVASTINSDVIATVTGTETLTNKTLTAPKFADNGFISDPSANPMLAFDTLASGLLAAGSGSLSVSNGPSLLVTTGASGTGTTATVEYTAANSTQIPVGASVTIAGVSPAGYNGTYAVTASSVGSISYANTTTGAQTSSGTVSVAPAIAALGVNSNIDINLVPKGTGTVQSRGREVVTTTGTQTLSDKTLVSPANVSSTTGNPVIIAATGPDTNIDINLTPKGSGSVLFGGVSPVMPTGAVVPFAGASAPTGWLLAFGQAVSRTTYAALFAVVNTTYGAGDGSTTFNVPDLRGRLVAGQDDMGGTSANRLTGLTDGVDGDVLGGTGGLESNTLTEAQMPAHKHASGVLHKISTNVAVYGSTTIDVPGSASSAHDSGFGSNTSSDQPWTQTVGSSAAHNNVQPTLILNYIIKL